MIDRVHLSLSIHLTTRSLVKSQWHKQTNDEGCVSYFHKCRDVVVRYYPDTEKLTIRGKLITWLYDTQVLNVDDIYQADTKRFIAEINQRLNSLFSRPIVDIRDFRATRMDYCFNIQTPHVTQYIEFLTQAFNQCNSGTQKNFTQEHGLHGSVYIKTRSDYNKNELRNYVINYYDKTDRLRYQQAHGQRITAEDFQHARGILRLEIQCGFQFLKTLQKKLNIGDTFGELFSYRVAFCAHETRYSTVFHCNATQDFFTYAEAKKLLPSAGHSAQKVLLRSSQHHSITSSEFAYGRKKLQEAGIYPYAFLPKHSPASWLPNPLKLIYSKLLTMGIVLE